MKHTGYENPHYAFFSSILPLPLSYIQIFSLAACSQNTLNLCSFPNVTNFRFKKKRNRIVTLEILIFVYSERRR